MVRTPGEIFAFMSSNKIGDKVALFWIAWAFVAEKANNFKLTDQIFQKGIRRFPNMMTMNLLLITSIFFLRRFAEPKELLQKRYHQFQRRLARHYLNSDPSTDSSSAESSVFVRSYKLVSNLNCFTFSRRSSSIPQRTQGVGILNYGTNIFIKE